jgi:Rha family phage regulatory protein
MENPLVTTKGQKLVTDSLRVAEESGKTHDFILRKVRSLMKDDEKDRLIFAEISYQDSYGREQKKYIMDRRSFSILSMRFTGKKALKWQNRFVDAFEAMERMILQRQNLSWQQARLEGKETRLDFTDSLKKVVEFADVSGSKNPKTYYTTFTKMIYSLLFDLKKVPKNFRDSLNKETLKQLQMIEWKASQWIDEAISHSKDYHEPYYEVKAKVQSLVDVIGRLKLYEEIEA